MSMTGRHPGVIERLRPYGGRRFLLLVGTLFGLLLGFALCNRARDPWDSMADDRETPTKEAVLNYLRSQSNTPTEVANATGQDQPFGKQKGRIESLEIKRGYDSTRARFGFITDQASYDVEVLIVHGHAESTSYPDGISVLKASRR
jgi:hypothetical protein